MARLRRPPARSPEAAASTPATPANNHIVAAVLNASEDERTTLLEQVHPLFAAHQTQYRLLLDAYEGSGGFLDGTYLWKYPNEKNDEFQERQKQARYHNYVRALVNIYVRHVFRAGVKREATALPDLEAWWKNVDGAGTSIDDYMKRGAKLALATGLAGALVDKEPTLPAGPSKAEDRAKVIASWFPAQVIVDWTERAGELVGVKLLEAQARAGILAPATSGDNARQYLVWDETAWARFTNSGGVVNQSDEAKPLGLVPLAVVRPDPSSEHPFLGHALAGHANVFRAHYNRCSEEDEVLRDQAFSILTVSVPVDGDVSEAKKDLGTDVGTTRAIVVKGEVKYETPDMQAPEQIRKNIEGLVREIYRMAHVRFERDSLAAESADAIRLQHTELNEMLANLAACLQGVERQIVRFWYAWTHPGTRAQIDEQFDKVTLTLTYPNEFFITDLIAELEKWAAAIAMDLGLTFEKFAKRRVLDQMAAGASTEELQAMRAEIDGQTVSTRQQQVTDAQARFELNTLQRFGKGGEMPGGGAAMTPEQMAAAEAARQASANGGAAA